MKIFIDTNIFLDLILKREKYNEALMIFDAVEQQLYEAVILDITILNIDYIAKRQIKDIKEFLTLINNTFKVVGGSNKSILDALKINNNDLEDNLQYISAKDMKCDLIITNDKNFYSNKIEISTSNNFCKNYLLT
jgi:predicted nucleic acid-binding protein